MIDSSIIVKFTELTTEARGLHDALEMALEQTSDEMVELEAQKRRESTMRLRELLYKIDGEMQLLENMKRLVRIGQGWNSVDIRSLESLKWELLSEKKRLHV